MSKAGSKARNILKKTVRSHPSEAEGPLRNYFKTVINAQTASAGPPLGPLLGKYGLNIGNFCKMFNEQTKNIKRGVPLPVTVRIKPDRSYNIDIHTPPEEFYLMQAAGITVPKDPEDPTAAGKVTIKHIYEIAKIKHKDPFSKLYLYEFEDVVKHLVGIATVKGIEVVRNLDPEEYKQFLAERFEYLKEKELRMAEELKAKVLRSKAVV